MYQEERLFAILQHMQAHQRISVEEICELFQVSRDTARRDIVKLEEQGKILRTRGGAICPSLNKDISGYRDRLEAESDVKRNIGRLAASLIHSGDYLFMDASTTVLHAAEQLRTDGHVIVTNSIDIAGLLSPKQGSTVHLLGGVVHPHHRFISGARTLEMLRDYQADKLILGTSGLTPEGLTNPFEEEGYVMKEMIRRADQVIVLADHTKFGLRQFYRVAGLDCIDIVITDRPPAEPMSEALRRHHIEILIAEGENER
ncbi:DeoR/GlpR family DNA-binding transcription regulator [Paenibacillus tyrfis]|uniref:DeoR faimly transcriptional regulator n=1 Tax=Paenibacillus tyrfis TaxID=1501230 RepID=A0A081P4I0_9BACL|nr:DeoR/GlpR family DNA-binding transcription regulator [Paenibacillus tyrfis]KEQ25603.1 DeoR faimly transcriptional regulator [Paenibacillus tyrfis]